jgi:hypothetical protein
VRTLPLALAALVLTACGSSGGGSTGYADIDAVAQAAKCDSFSTDDDPMMFAAKSGSCTLPSGDDVYVSWFNNNEARDKYLDVGISNGAVYVYGDKWLIECQDADAQAEAAKSTKGDKKG